MSKDIDWCDVQNEFCKAMARHLGKSENGCYCREGMKLLGLKFTGEWSERPPKKALNTINLLIGPNGFVIFKMLEARRQQPAEAE